MIHPLLTVAFDDVSAKESNGFVRHLAFAGALFDGLEVFDWVPGSAESSLKVKADLIEVRMVVRGPSVMMASG